MVMRERVLFNTLLAAVVLVCGLATPSAAHELQPGYLELRLIGEDQYAVTWKVPAARGRPMAIAARLPANVELVSPRTIARSGRYLINTCDV